MYHNEPYKVRSREKIVVIKVEVKMSSFTFAAIFISVISVVPNLGQN